MNHSPTFLVTGATGFIGLKLCKKLRRQFPNSKIIAQSRNEKNLSILSTLKVDFMPTSLKSIESFDKSICEADYVFHLAANPNFSSKDDLYEDNVLPVKLLCNILSKSEKIKRLIFTSTIGAIDRLPSDFCYLPLTEDSTPFPSSKYGESKLQAEKIITSSSIPWTIVRPTWVYGQGMRSQSHLAFFLSTGMYGKILSRFKFPGRVSTIHVDDLIEAIVTSALSNDCLRKSFIICEDKPVVLGDVLRYGLESTQKTTWQIYVPRFFNFLLSPIWKFVPFSYKVMFTDAYTTRSNFASITSWSAKRNFFESYHEILNSIRGKDGYIILTGAASGIGRSLANKLKKEGYSLFLVDIDNSVSELSRQLGAAYTCVDMTTESAIDHIMSKLCELNINASGIIHCAGVGWRGNFECQGDQNIKDLIALNLTFPILFTQRLMPFLKNRTSSIVSFIASSISTVPLPFMTIYGTTKAGLLSFALSLKGECIGTPINVSVILPSGTKTNFQEKAGVKLFKKGARLLDPDQVAERIIDAIAHKKTGIFVGQIGKLLSIITSFLPFEIKVKLWRRLMLNWR